MKINNKKVKKNINNINIKVNMYICYIMDRLFSISQDFVHRSSSGFSRFLLDRISLTDRITGIIGCRGIGKSSLLLQCMKGDLSKDDKGLYVSLDDLYFSTTSLLDFAREFYRMGGTHLFLDDLHKYSKALIDLNGILDELPELKIIFASSAFNYSDEDGLDLKKMARLHFLPGMSFREFLDLRYQLVFPFIQFDELLELNRNPGITVLNRIRPLQYFDEYLREGYYTVSSDSTPEYQSRVIHLLNHVLEGDFPAIHHIDFDSVEKIRRLLSIIAVTGPLKPNIERLAAESGTTRDSLLKFLKYMHQADLISWITRVGEDLNYLNKPELMCLNNSNLVAAVSPGNPGREAMLETFLISQMQIGHRVNLTKEGNLLIDDKYSFSLSWKQKGNRRVGLKNDGYTLCDGLDYQTGTRIPLWMLGFLY